MHSFLHTVRRGLQTRPLSAIFLTAVCWLGVFFAAAVWSAVLALAAATLLFVLQENRPAAALVCLLLTGSLALHGHFAPAGMPPGEGIRLVQGAPVLAGDTEMTFALGRVVGGPLIVLYGRAGQLKPGHLIHTRAVPERPSPARNPGGFDERAWAGSLGAKATLRLDGGEVAQPEAGIARLRYWWWQARKDIFARIGRHFDADTAAWLAAFAGGGTRSLGQLTKTRLSQLSLSHLTSVSGLHVSYLLLPFSGRRLNRHLSRRARRWLHAVLLGLIYFLADGQSGVARAVLMRQAGELAATRGIAGDTAETLAAAGGLMLLLSPYRLRQDAFWLSLLAVLAIGSMAGPLADVAASRWPRLPAKIIDMGAVTTAAQFAVLPLLVCRNEAFTPLGLAANLALAVAAQAMTLLALLTVTALPLFALVGGGDVLAYLLEPPLDVLRHVFGRVLNLPPLLLWLPGFASPFAAFLYLGLLFFWLRRQRGWRIRRRHMRVLRASMLLLLSLTVLAPYARLLAEPGLTVWLLDVGQGDCIVMRHAGGETWLLDAGEPGQGHRTIWPFMKAAGIGRIDLAIVSHGHQDHAGGLSDLLQLGLVRAVAVPAAADVAAPVTPAPADRYADYDMLPALLTAAAAAGVPVRRLHEGDTLTTGAVSVSVLPIGLADGDCNDMSLQLYLRHGAVSMLFTADATAAVETVLTGLAAGRLTVLKVAHHGSRFTTGEAFVGAYRPAVAVLSVGYNVYGHPSDACLANLAAADAAVYRTDRHGAVRLRSDGTKVDVRTWLK